MDDMYNSLYFFFETHDHYEYGMCPVENLDEGYCGYQYYFENGMGVFIPAEDTPDFRETFSNVVLESAEFSIGGSQVRGLQLRCNSLNDKAQLSPFTLLCTSFLDTKEGRREKLISDPEQWCELWKNILGNRTSERSAYPVVAELLLLKELLEKGYDPVWSGPERGVNDVITKPPMTKRFEVKSTLSRTSRTVVMSEEFQADTADYLCFYRFEEVKAGGTSINKLIEELEKLGMKKNDLQESLNKLGFTDTLELNCEYKLLENDVYPVDGEFPDIMKFFIDGIKPNRIDNISYSIDLSGLKTVEIPDFIDS